MRISGWFVEGFGVFRDYEVRDLAGGLTVFLGPNEAGKSTLLAFLRGVLFGFASRRTRETHYPPLQGGRHGGRITLAGPDGDLTVERFASQRDGLRILLADGREGSDEQLRNLLGGADERLFRSIFAFTLTDLQSLEWLEADEVRDRIFSAGIAGAGRSARQVITRLEAEQKMLLRQRSAARINSFAASIEETARKLSAARQEAERYPAMLEQEDRWRVRVAELGAQADNLRRRHQHLEALIELWAVWLAVETARRELAGLPVIGEFPSDPELRLATLAEQMHAAQTAVDRLEAERASKSRLVLELGSTVDERLAPLDEPIAEHYGLLSLQRDRLRQLPAVRWRRDQTEIELRKKLRQLGPEWDEGRLDGLNISVAVSEEVRSWQKRLEQAERTLLECRHGFEAAVQERQRTERSLGPEPETDRVAQALELEQREQALRRMRLTAGELRVEHSKGESLQRLVEEHERAAEAAKPRVSPAGWLALAGFAAMCAVAGWLLAQARFSEAYLLIGLDAAVALALIWLWRQAWIRYREALADLRSAQLARDTCHERIVEMDAIAARDAMVLGLSPNALPEDLENVALVLAGARQALAREESARLRHAESLEEERRRGEALDAAESAARGLATEWAEWQQAAGVPGHLSPQTLLEFFAEAQLARNLVAARDEARANLVQLTRETSAWEQLAQTWLNTEAEGEDLIARFLELYQRSRRAQEARARAASLAESIAEIDRSLETGQRELKRCQEAFHELLAEAKATDEADFHSRMRCFRRRQELARIIRDAEGRIRERIGRGAEADALENELSSGRIEEWKEQANAVHRNLVANQPNRDEAVGKLRLAEAARKELEESAAVVTLEAELAALIAELARLACQWRVTTLARALLERTLRDFSRTRQPAVLEEASAAFARITANAYHRVVQDETAESLTVLTPTMQSKRPEALSRGTAEQLYLCLRLALAAEFERRSAPLPLVMDDVLVNFDPERARAVARELSHFARHRQVLLFTCHPETVHLIRETDPRTRLILLERPGASTLEE